MSEPQTVWVAHGHRGHGEEARVVGAYANREAAFRGLKELPNMTVYVDERGHVIGRPVNERTFYRMWAEARPYEVQE